MRPGKHLFAVTLAPEPLKKSKPTHLFDALDLARARLHSASVASRHDGFPYPRTMIPRGIPQPKRANIDSREAQNRGCGAGLISEALQIIRGGVSTLFGLNANVTLLITFNRR